MIYEIKIIKKVSNIIERLGILFIPIYLISFLFPRNKNIWLFGSTLGKSFTGNPKYMYIYLNQIESDIKPIWISKDDNVIRKIREKGYEAYNLYSIKGLFYSGYGKVYIFDHYSKDISFWFSGRTKKINLWHGIPLKKGHGDNKFDRVRNPRNIYDRVRWVFRRIQNEKPSHYYTVTSEFIKKIHVRAFRAEKERVFTCGYPRTDILVDNDYLNKDIEIVTNNYNFYKKIYNKINLGYKLIIYMPTHRSNDDIFYSIIDLEELNGFLKDRKIILLVKSHHMSKLTNEFKKINYSNILSINIQDDPYPYLAISEILITDYSSVYFDFLLKDKPIIFFAYDLETYIEKSRELYYDYDSITPGYKVKNMESLLYYIDYIVNNGDNYKTERKEVLEKMFNYKDGKSSERLYEQIIDLL